MTQVGKRLDLLNETRSVSQALQDVPPGLGLVSVSRLIGC